jgi:hypothetical protein
MKTRIVSLLLVIALISLPLSIKAFTIGLPFGGFVAASTVCTCPPFGVMINYGILYFGGPVPLVGTLLFPVGAILYAWFQLGVPKTWNLGQAVPGGVCNMLNPAVVANGDPCAPPLVIPVEGTIQYMGTSRLF